MESSKSSIDFDSNQRERYGIPKELLELMADHVFFPKKKTGGEASNICQQENALLKLILEVIVGSSVSLPPSTGHLFKTMVELHCDGRMEKAKVASRIGSLLTGQMFGLYIRAQNCAFLIYAPPNGERIVTTSHASVPNKVVSSSPSDIQVDYPTRKFLIPNSEILASIDFAEQLGALCEKTMTDALPTSRKAGHDVTETRDVANDAFVSEWLCASLSNRSSAVASNADFPQITKKIRDEIVYDKGDKPFRRSGMWMTIKIFLQLNLCIEYGEIEGTVRYKALLLEAMCKMSKVWLRSDFTDINIDLAMQMLAKIARRNEKLKRFAPNFGEIVEPITKTVIETIEAVRSKIDLQFQNLIARDELVASYEPLTNVDFESDIVHTIPRLKSYTQKRINFQPAKSEIDNFPRPEPIARHRENNIRFPDISLLESKSSEDKLNLTLVDFEVWIAEHLETQCRSADVSAIRKLTFAYSETANAFYTRDPLGGSRMILSILKIIQVLDQIGIEKSPMLKEHRSGIDPRIINDLLLPKRKDLELALSLQTYFTQRNAAASYPSLIDEVEAAPSPDSFAVRYAERNTEMKALREKILRMEKEKIAAKKFELAAERSRLADCRRISSQMSCLFLPYTDSCGINRSRHDPSCSKCSLESQIKNARVSLYERPLRNEAHNQYAIVFELKMPKEFACLRDVLHHFVYKFCNATSTFQMIFGKWTDYGQIALDSSNMQEKVFLGSSSKLVMSSHYSEPKHPDHHPDEAFIVNNGYNCIYVSGINECMDNTTSQTVKKYTTFCVEGADEEYSNMQWMVSGTRHTQNKVMATQSACPPNLQLSEYKSFGSLRSDGHCLQIRNIYREIATESLSFETSSVMFLIMQALWEAGPNTKSTWQRESHEDFCDPIFTREMITLLNKYLNAQRHNWKQPMKLMLVIIIAVRILEMNDDPSIIASASHLLLECRNISCEWIAKIQIAKANCDCTQTNDISELRNNLSDAAICCGLTFMVDCNTNNLTGMKSVLLSNATQSIYQWTLAIVIIQENILLTEASFGDMTAMRRNALRIIRNIGINNEHMIQEQIRTNSEDLKQFTKDQWAGAKTCTFDAWTQFADIKQVVYSKLTEPNGEIHYVSIDLIRGVFLVDNAPVSRLPTAITSHPVYQRLFGAAILEVQPTGGQVFCTKYSINGYHYFFQFEHSDLIIKEQSSDGIDYELIAHTEMTDEIPFLLIDSYSHWWNRGRNILVFRPKRFSPKGFHHGEKHRFELNFNSGFLTDSQTDRKFIDIRSPTYNNIVPFLGRLEDRKYVHVIREGFKKATVHLPRMSLQFKIDLETSTDIVSHEGKIISLKQKMGFFIGLGHGLLLEDRTTKQKIIVVPHGQISVDDSLRGHLNVSIGLENLRSPTFFEYSVDERCRILTARSSVPAWLFLVHLHAITAHPLPDPFTGMTGTERAFQLLQCGYVWSTAPYDVESQATLTDIANLSPKRTFYPEHLRCMQCNEWPDLMSSSAAHDGYRIIVEKLFEASYRLSLHHSPDSADSSNDTELSLSMKAYWRHINQYPNTKLSENFSSVKNYRSIHHHVIDRNNKDVLNSMRKMAALSKEKSFYLPPAVKNCLLNFMITDIDLTGQMSQPLKSILSDISKSSFRDHWVDLYNTIRKRKMSDSKIQLILTYLLFAGVESNQIHILQAIAMNADEFASMDPPAFQKYECPSDYEFSNEAVLKQFKSCQIEEDTYIERHESRFCNADEPRKSSIKSELRSEFRRKVETQAAEMMHEVKRMWPCSSIPPPPLRDHSDKVIEMDAAMEKVNATLNKWNKNRLIRLFLSEVGDKLSALNSKAKPEPNLQQWSPLEVPEKAFVAHEIDFAAKMCKQYSEHEFLAVIGYCQSVFKMGRLENDDDNYLNSSNNLWIEFERMSILATDKHLILAGLYPRIVPVVILPMLLSSQNERQKAVIGAIAVKISVEQRLERIAKLKEMPEEEDKYKSEIDALPYENWSPSEYPGWIIFQIENDLTIRRIQVEIAKTMISPPGGGHSVTQLNMGEGKTSVIVPLLAIVLANGEQLCQITVPRSHLQTDLRSWRQALGGMLNRHFYTFPCRRDMKIDNSRAQVIQSCYEECKSMLGVAVTVPEYRLSFQLKLYESARGDKGDKGDEGEKEAQEREDLARSLKITHDWLNRNVRSILDESDAILQPKYQVIYTVGTQLSPSGGNLRWTVLQDLLKCVPRHMYDLWKKYGSKSVEFNESFMQKNGQEIFCPCRILDPSIHAELKSRIADDFILGRTNIKFVDLKEPQRKDLKDTILNPHVEDDVANRCYETFGDKTSLVDTVLILSGLLKYDVLLLALTKRWRVHYGVSENGKRKMAIPFKAKDVAAAETTEFGHLDVAIALTHLSYYYSGLSDSQLRECIASLSLLQNPEECFNSWIEVIQFDIDPSIRSYTGINLADPKQRDEYLFPALRYNMYVIDFWLSHCVLPREAKLFDGKMMCTAWDLCSDDMHHPVTGFSGTNDTQLLLPMPVRQNDLRELEGTNEQVRGYLLLPENNNYRKLPSCVSGQTILETLVTDEIPVLLDCGALVLEMNNQQVAERWLKLAPENRFQCAVYFNAADVLMSHDRNGFEVEFELSPFRERLQCCLVYLDDVHTRGTDLRFPRGTRACVTLCGGITRDKTVQACMRMRLLGKGHTLSFWASEEADNGIRMVGGKTPDADLTTENVVNWICDNSKRFEKDSLIHWAAGGLNYCQKLAAHRDQAEHPDLSLLNARCTDKEIVELRAMYGVKTECPLTDILNRQFDRLVNLYSNPNICEWITTIQNDIIQKLDANIPDEKRFTQFLDEEQEKELKHEHEDEREIYRPGCAEPRKPTLDKIVVDFIRNGDSAVFRNAVSKTIFGLPFALQKTKLWPIAQENCWGTDIFVTKDFVDCVLVDCMEDEFMRQVSWIVSASSNNSESATVLLIISPHEANAYLNIFRSKQSSTTLHMYSYRLKADQSIFIENTSLQIPAFAGPNISDQHKSQLTVFSGSLFFENIKEQDAYCHFLGLIPRPRSDEHNKAFEENLMDVIGFVPPENRHICEKIQNTCPFQKCPDALVKGIVERRIGFLPRASHVSHIVTESKKPFIE